MSRRTCLVDGCQSNVDLNQPLVTTFGFPTDEKRRKEWCKIIQWEHSKLLSKSAICAKHFEERFIVRESKVVGGDGNVIPRYRPKLTPDAYPTIFPEETSAYPSIFPEQSSAAQSKSQSGEPPSNEETPAEGTSERGKTSSFNWRPYLRKSVFSAAPVSCFNHVALSNCWDSIVLNVRIEVRSPDCKTCCTTTPCCYWLATVIKVCGYWGLLRYDGSDKLSPHYFNIPDKWVNLCTEPHIHPVGWCAANKKPLVPPKNLEPKIISWKEFLTEILINCRTLPKDFTFNIEDHLHTSIKKGMKLEVVDKNLISVVRSAVVTDVVGGRLHIKYAENAAEDEGFWCHERSPLIHPVGWAQTIGHALKARPEYARKSLKKTLFRTFEPDDATWDMFMPVYNPVSKLKFKVGMKLEAIDPLNLSTICVATVTEVLRNNYLMIGIDGMMAANGADCFCYHASSQCIFPVGFCEQNDIKLTPPRGYKGEFKWSEYLKKTKSEAAPVALFHKDVPDHGFKEGMYLEAVDLMEPRLICVAYVTKVVGRLLKIHFDGWEEDYDQWCDYESPDLFPIGWCDVMGYRLEPPRVVENTEEKKKKKPMKVIKRRGKRKNWSKKPTSSDESPIAADDDDVKEETGKETAKEISNTPTGGSAKEVTKKKRFRKRANWKSIVKNEVDVETIINSSVGKKLRSMKLTDEGSTTTVGNNRTKSSIAEESNLDSPVYQREKRKAAEIAQTLMMGDSSSSSFDDVVAKWRKSQLSSDDDG